jgi:4,5-DOPA dioxygenase extradiol
MNNPVFIGHGSPLNAVRKNDYAAFLADYARSIQKPDAIVVISAHWQTKGTFVTGAERPGQIYDFYGFPDELYELTYAPKGDPDVAKKIHAALPEIGIHPTRGIDHAGWAVVTHLYPGQDVPLLEVSLDVNKTEREHYELGKKMAALSESVLFIGSGNIVHNLSDISYTEQDPAFPWAKEADAWVDDNVRAGKIDELIDYRTSMPNYRRAIPTNEHYLPFLYILGMKSQDAKLETIYEEIQNGSISMRSFRVR